MRLGHHLQAAAVRRNWRHLLQRLPPRPPRRPAPRGTLRLPPSPCPARARRTSAQDSGKVLLDAMLGEVVVTCEKLTWLIDQVGGAGEWGR